MTRVPVNPLARTGPAKTSLLLDWYRSELAEFGRVVEDDRLRDALVSEATRNRMAEFHCRQAEEEERRLRRELMLGR
jgi:hypothetical protein